MPDEQPGAVAGLSLADLLERIAASSNPELEIVALTAASARQHDPELAEAIYYCAIPRQFDAAIIGALRQAPSDALTNRRLLGSLAAYRFVRRREDGAYTVEDRTRAALLDDWKRSDENYARFTEYNRRLIDHFEAQHREAHRLARDLDSVAAIVHRASRERYAQLASTLEKRLVAPLMEGLYHAALQSFDEGYAYFTRYAYEYELQGKASIAYSLCTALQGMFQQLPLHEQDPKLHKWLRYWGARLARRLDWEARAARRLGLEDEAEAVFRDLLRDAGDDRKLQLWTLSELGSVLAERFKLHDARRVGEEELALSLATEIDPYNLPLVYDSLASRNWQLAELGEAARLFEKAIAVAHANANRHFAVYSRLNLAGVQQDRGEWDTAIGLAMEALHVARVEFAQEIELQRSVGSRVMFLVARHDPRLLDALYTEITRLPLPAQDPRPTLYLPFYLQLDYAQMLRESGQFTRAAESLERLRAEADAYAGGEFWTDVLLQEGLLADDRARSEEAIAKYSEIIERGAQPGLVTPWNLAAALSNRGLELLTRGRREEAAADLEAAIEKWQAIGHDKFVALMHVAQADLRRLKAYQTWLDRHVARAEPAAAAAEPAVMAHHHRLVGEQLRLQGRWAEAIERYDQARALNLSAGHRAHVVTNQVDLAALTGGQGQWSQAAAWMEECEKLCRRGAEQHLPGAPGMLVEGTNAAALWAEAQALLDSAHGAFDDADRIYDADFHQTQADLLADQGHWTQANEHYRRAFALNYSVARRQNAARNLGSLVYVTVAQGRWEDAAAHAAEAVALWRRLAEFDAYRPTEKEIAAARQNAEGLRFFAEPDPQARDVRAAYDRFRKAKKAITRASTGSWFSLNLAYASAELGAWAEAARAVKTVLERGPYWLHSPSLYQQQIEFRLRQAEASMAAAKLDESRAAYLKCLTALNNSQERLPADYLSAARLRLADGFLQLGSMDEAREQYELEMRRAAGAARREHTIALGARLALLHAIEGDFGRTCAWLRSSFEPSPALDDDDTVRLFVEAVTPLLQSLHHFLQLGEALRMLAADEDGAPHVRRAFVAVQLALSRAKYLSLLRPIAQAAGNDASPFAPIVTPLGLEVAERLFEAGGGRASKDFLDTSIPAVKARLQARWGVPAPEIRIRTNEYWAAGEYSILLKDVPVAGGDVGEDEVFYVDAAACSAAGITGRLAYNPVTELQGIWVPKPRLARDGATRLEHWDAYQFLAAHLEIFMQSHLSHFMGFQETQAAVGRWADGGGDLSHRLQELLPDDTARIRLHQVVQGLLNESVTVRDLGAILEAFATANGKHVEIQAVTEDVRMALRRDLPGNDGTRTPVALSTEYEAAVRRFVWEAQGKQTLAITPAEALRLIQSARDFIGDRPANRLALVVENASVRPYVRRLLETDFPSLAVLARRELLVENAEIRERLELVD